MITLKHIFDHFVLSNLGCQIYTGKCQLFKTMLETVSGKVNNQKHNLAKTTLH